MHNSTTASSEPRICIVGAGMSGILMAIKLLEAGIKNFVIFEKSIKNLNDFLGRLSPNGASPQAFRACLDRHFLKSFRRSPIYSSE